MRPLCRVFGVLTMAIGVWGLGMNRVSLITTSNGSSNHAWFPQAYAAFHGGMVSVVNVQHHDDGPCVASPGCKSCHKPQGCDPGESVLVSYDYGVSWDILSTVSHLSIGSFALNDSSTLMPSAYVSPKNNLEILANSSILSYDGSAIRVQSGAPMHYGIYPVPIVQVNLWCDPIVHQDERIMVMQTGHNSTTSQSTYRALSLLASSDGWTWERRGLVANGSTSLFSPYTNGPCESGVTILPDSGDIFVVFRVDSFAHYFHARSSDGGFTFSTPKPFVDTINSVRPRLHVIPPLPRFPGEEVVASSDASPGVFLIGGRPGLMMWHGDGNATTSSFTSFNLAFAHNSFFPNNASYQYAHQWANRTEYPDFSLHGSTAYTSVFPTTSSHCPQGEYAFNLYYDHLAHGWDGPPGPYGTEDLVFAAELCVG